MKVLHVTPYFPPAWAYGGPPRSVFELCRELVRCGHEVTVLTTDACDAALRAEPPHETLEGVDVHRLPNLSNGLAWRRQFFLPLGMRKFLARRIEKFDLVHLHMYRTVQDILVHRNAARSRIPYVFAARGSLPRIVRGMMAKATFDALYGKRVLRDASFCIASSLSERSQYGGMGVPDERIRTIHNGLDWEAYQDLPPAGSFLDRTGLRGNKLITYVGRLNARKGLDHLVHAFRYIKQEAADVTLVLVGPDDGYRRQVERLVGSLGLSDHVLFMGLLSGRDRLAAFVDANVVVYPAKHEIFGLVPFEALACGKPVVVSDDSGCGEIIGNAKAGYVVPVEDIPRLVDAVQSAMENGPQTRAMVERGRKFVSDSLAWDVIGSETISLYREVLAGSGPEVASA